MKFPICDKISNYIHPVCSCGGMLSAKLATMCLVCLDCSKEYGVYEK